MKKIGIIGSGQVGKALANGFAAHGYDVMIGSRSPEKQKELQEEIGNNVLTGDFSATAAYGEIIVLAVKGLVATDALHIVGPSELEDKIIIDTTNPIAESTPENGVLSFFTTLKRSLMEDLQETFPDARFVKAFSCVGSHLMVNPAFEGDQKPSMFICGDDNKAKEEVSKITELFGFETEDMGPVTAARAIEPLCILWCIPGFRENSWNHAFKLLKN